MILAWKTLPVYGANDFSVEDIACITCGVNAKEVHEYLTQNFKKKNA